MSEHDRPPQEQPSAEPVPGRHPPADAYNFVADKVGMVPNVRLKDNVIQAVAVIIGMVLGGLAGVLYAAAQGPAQSMLLSAIIGIVVGMVVGVFLSGLVLMIVGLRRKS